MEVIYTADAPVTTGTFNFTITTSGDTYPATSNQISVSTSGSTLTASSLAFGANATYTITGVPVANLTSGGTTLTLVANATAGTETINFYNGSAGYTRDVHAFGRLGHGRHRDRRRVDRGERHA